MSNERSKKSPLTIVIGLFLLGAAVLAIFVWRRGGREDAAATAARERAQEQASAFLEDPTLDPNAAAGAIEGMVRDADGKPIDGAAVALVRARPRDVPTFTPPRPTATTSSTGGGRFVFESVQPGEYALTAIADAGTPAVKRPVAVTSGARARVELALGRGGLVLSGRVLDVGGGAVPGARVTTFAPAAFNGTGAPPLLQAVADGDGAYRFTLARGQYFLRAEAEGYAPSQDSVSLARAQTKDLRLIPAARLSGRVVEAGTGQPVEGADVTVRKAERFGGGFWRDTKSDRDGRFSFTDMEPDSFEVTARKGALVGAGKVVTVGTADTIEGVEVRISPALTIAGQVVGPDGRGVAGARLSSWDMRGGGRGTFGKTAADGTFKLEGVLAGGLRLRVDADGFAPGGQQVDLRGKDVTGVRIALTGESQVSGVVVDAKGAPVEGAMVNANVRGRGGPMGDYSWAQAVSKADGTFVLDKLGVGTAQIAARHDERGAATLTQALEAADKKTIRLELAAGTTISGKVSYEGGGPAAGVNVNVHARSPDGPMLRPVADTTDDQGRFRLEHVPTGPVMVAAHRKTGGGYSFGGGDLKNQKELRIVAGENKTDVDLVVKRGGHTIKGVVLTPDGKPATGAFVAAGPERPGGGPAVRRSFGGGERTIVDQEGAFTLEDLDEGKYTLWASHAVHADAQQADVASGATGVKLQLQPDTRIAGVVTMGGAPLADYTVTLMPGPTKPNETPEEKMRRQRGPGSSEAPTRRVFDPSGAFSFARLKEGSYELRVSAGAGGVGSLVVAVKTGEKKEDIRIALEAGLKITGRVAELEGGAPIPGAQVRVSTNGPDGPTAMTDATGAFTLEGVAPDPKINVSVFADDRTFVYEHKEVEPTAGATTIDAGVFKLMRGNSRERMTLGSERGHVGVRARVDKDGRAILANVHKGGAAEQAGLKEGDVVVSIAGRSVAGMGQGALGFLLDGKAGDKVDVSVESGGVTKTVTLTRATFGPPKPPAVATK